MSDARGRGGWAGAWRWLAALAGGGLLLGALAANAADPPALPSGWELVREGSPLSRITRDKGKDPDEAKDDVCVLEPARDGMIGLKRLLEAPLEAGAYVIVAKLTAGDLPAGLAAGVFLNYDNGALLRCEKVRGEQGQRLRFTAAAGAKQYGAKEVACPEGELTLALRRAGNNFAALYRLGRGKWQQFETLAWPDLPAKGMAGCHAAYRPTGEAPVQQRVPVSGCRLRFQEAMENEVRFCIHQIGAYDAAKGHLREAYDLFGPSADLYWLEAQLHDQTGDAAACEQTMRALLQRDPNHAGALNYLGYDLIERGEKLEEAVALVKRATELDDRNMSYADSLGWGYYRLGQLDEAAKELERAITLARAGDLGEHTIIFDHLARVYGKQGKDDAAKNVYVRLRAWLQEQMAKRKAAGQELRAYHHAALGWATFHAGDLPEAMEAYDQAIAGMREYTQLWPWFTEVFERYGDVCVAADRGPQAAGAYKEALEFAGNFRQTDSAKRLIAKGRALFVEPAPRPAPAPEGKGPEKPPEKPPPPAPAPAVAKPPAPAKAP